MNNISFQGKTNVIFNDSLYEQVINRQTRGGVTNLNLSISKNYKIHNARRTAYNPNESTEPAVLILNEKGGVFFHDAESKISEIFEYIQKLQTTAKDKLTAWIIGGQGGEQTTRKVNTIAEVLCDRPDIDTSIIAGQKSIAPNLTIYPTTEKLDITIGLPKKDDLENYFDIVELNNTKFTA